jgi:benzoyl-CoA reductase/2-hydroxyglutaryl-CoA dehydratase subunit BcrC/BadD/HgdB
MTSDIVTRFQQASEHSGQTLSKLHSQGKKLFGYFCTYTPIELLTACEYIPIRIMGGRGKTEQCYNFLPEFMCPFMKRSLEKAINGEYHYLSGIVQSYSCDAVCGSQAVWENNFDKMEFYNISPPYNDNNQARNYYIEEFRRLIEKLGKTYNLSLKKKLQESIELYTEIRQTILAVYGFYQVGSLEISSEEMWYVFQAGFVIPPRDYLVLLQDLSKINSETPVQQDNLIPVVVSGSAIEHPDILTYIEEIGGKIVWDDHCTGIRSFEPVNGAGPDPLEQLVDRYMRRLPCASRCKAEDRWARWEEAMNQLNPQGVIFIIQKFCTPHLSDYPYLKDQLQRKNIPTIVIEMDESWEVSGQIKTRLEGFMDMIGDQNG